MTSAPSSPRLALALGALLALSCRRATPPPDDPERTPTIFVDPGSPDPHVPAPEGPATGDPEAAPPDDRPHVEIRGIAPDEETPDFKGTLEEMAGDPPSREREGVAGVATCEGGARQVGESWKVKCNTCTCGPSGESTCTLMACIGD
ncbi:MAG: hypothetical protein H6710_17210 [Myxococcales bacterium]|nr:hypothetical protein [Myxococcales bacterium]